MRQKRIKHHTTRTKKIIWLKTSPLTNEQSITQIHNDHSEDKLQMVMFKTAGYIPLTQNINSHNYDMIIKTLHLTTLMVTQS